MNSLIPLGQTQLQEYVTALAWGDRHLLAASAAGEVYHIDPEVGEQLILQTATDQSLTILAVASDRQWWAAAGEQGRVLIGSLAHPENLQVLHYGSHWIDQLAWHPTLPWVAFSLGHYVQIWDAAQADVIATLDFAASSVLALAWQPTGDALAVAGYGGVRVWSAKDWDADPQELGFMSATVGVAWSATGEYFAASNMDHTLFVWRWGDQYPWHMQGFPGKVRHLHWLETANQAPQLLSSSQEGIILWRLSEDASGWQPQVLDLHRGTVRALSIHPQGQGFVSSGDEGWLCYWQKTQPQELLQGAQEYFTTLAWHPKGSYLAAGGTQGELWVWQAS
ncbi:WD40 repeat domain-containing protein [Thermosynechococcus sp. JY1334]|uniref:WD40 repeat domain-containing protein n=1 Tax=unclassified Thermosynechococcus TaxID=2622553 RepID=UPI0026716620|nr:MULTISPECIES: WD40 repeat domain-containing protein [unclassified Thermosynechococcus]MDR7896955.1 WD40 repeat domain-containing protein [Thermosynechococcus sp. JY1332]MDR7904352.1 WD40 repeat domain-containing protein [Thermosynechococcus sp. JY1334]MDR7992190.1 WD40 repeat domain-containing protein [Thermosynechococcus sp. TG252]WKT86599.1 WD40 repeat domain-containing protein [Thermosynechococcus sp. JY1339]WNC55545.1 WD40 repeat domain-containing protein [Thermosynechococcus sp. JY1331